MGGNPFARSFDALHSKARSGQLPLFLLNGTIVESGSRILVSHLRHPQEFRGDLEHAFDHRRAAMRMSTAALMSARFTYVSPAGTYAPGTHVVDGGYFENSGVVTALQWWHELDEVITELDRDHPRDTIRDVFIYIDNNPPPSRRDLAAAHRSVAPDRADSLNTVSGLLPEMSPPVDALLHARGAHAVEARQRAERIFGAKDFIPFDTNRIDEGTRRRLDNAPLGWALSRTTQRLLDDALCTNQDHVKRVMSALPPRQP